MSRRKSLIKTVSIILSLLILLIVCPSGTLAVSTTDSTSEKISDLAPPLEYKAVSDNRVHSEEGDGLNTIVVDNGDGTHTMTHYDYPVKFVNSKGEIEDISLEIASAADGSYKTLANDIQTVFPKKDIRRYQSFGQRCQRKTYTGINLRAASFYERGGLADGENRGRPVNRHKHRRYCGKA